MTTAAKSVESSWKNVEASRCRCGAKPERSRRRRSKSVGDMCALDSRDNDNYPSNVPFSGKIGDSNGVKKGEKKTKKELFSHFFKKSDLDFSHAFRDNFCSRVYIFGSSFFVKKEVVSSKESFLSSSV